MLRGKPTKAKSSSMNNSYAGITRFRFIGYNLSHIGTPLFLRRKNRNKKFRKQKY